MVRFLRILLSLAVLITLSVVQIAAQDKEDGRGIYQDLSFEGVNLSPADTGFDNTVRAIGNYNGNLFIGGDFYTADGISASRVVVWTGANWTSVNWFPLGNPVYWFHEYGSELFVGQFLAHLNSWDGSEWTAHTPYLGGGWGGLYGLETFNNELIVGGGFDGDPAQPSYIAKWNGATWDTVGTGINGAVRVLDIYDGALIAGGFFTTAGGSVGNRIAQWNGSTWTPVGTGIGDGGVRALTIYNNELIAGGNFTGAGGNSVNNIAKWNGTNWQALGDGLDGWVEALTVVNDKLIAGGRFLNSGGSSTPYVASWNGASWNPIGTGFDGDVYALGEYNGYLIAGGDFTTAGGYVALWDNSTWRPVSDIVTDVPENEGSHLPTTFSLDQNYPNPFNPSTIIEFNLLRRSPTRIEILNISGQLVNRLLDQSMSAGIHSVRWDGTNSGGQKVSSGTYFYRLTVDDHAESRKMILIK